jgi:hypothetical protein
MQNRFYSAAILAYLRKIYKNGGVLINYACNFSINNAF